MTPAATEPDGGDEVNATLARLRGDERRALYRAGAIDFFRALRRRT